jgi:tripartite ATP-independent transporter DctM subunit
MISLGALIVLVSFLIIGIPIPLTFLASAAFFIYFGDYNPMSLVPYGYSKMNSVVLLTIPLFILAGSVMDKGGIGESLVGFVERFVGRIKGGLGIVTIVSCGVFGAISGSSSATLSCIGSIMAPRLRDSGYHPGFSGALIASSGVLGILIPPSMLMILYAWVGGQSVLASFLATVVPGVILIVLFSVVTLIYSSKNPNIRVYAKPVVTIGPDGREVKPRSAIPALLMPVIILGTIYGGVLTPTEAAAVSFLYAIPVGFLFYKRLNAKSLKETLVAGGITTGVIMIMLFAVMILSRLYVMENLPQQILALLTSVSENKTVIMLLINLFMVIIGMLMDDVSGVLLCTPILLPIAIALGISPIHFAAVVGVNLGMGNITPPTAPLLYLAGRVAQAEVKDMLRPTMALILFAWLPTLILTTFLPGLSTWLPGLFGFK